MTNHARHGNWKPAHAGVPQPGNPGFQSAIGIGYEGKHKAGCLGTLLLPFTAGLLGLAVVLLVLYRTFEA
jgi:hypothetical protein